MSEGNGLDFIDLQEIYNSNSVFLSAHIDQADVSLDWLIKEQEEMKKIIFKR